LIFSQSHNLSAIFVLVYKHRVLLGSEDGVAEGLRSERRCLG